ncbi:MAG TPA: T9SS type A sorting domain-containing protein [Chitinophagaceae bacterium]|nr:T9SS type A sorting domain-containing protein [Chitinophagaceae bacterium]
MKTRIQVFFTLLLLLVIIGAVVFVNSSNDYLAKEETLNGNEEKSAAYHYLRWKYEADMIRDPVTGAVPFGLREQEIEFSKTMPVRFASSPNNRTSVVNTYLPAGPNNIGGRTRALAYDTRYNGTSNRVIISGGVSGGLLRSADGGANWTSVMPSNEIHSVTSVAQDLRVGNQDIWYAGGGEYLGSSTDDIGAGYLSFGLFKSTDNGVTWARLPMNNITDHNGTTIAPGVPERFDHPFDFVHKIAVNPVNGDVYVAGHRRILRSSNGGSSFQTVFGSSTASFAANGQSDIAISPTGKVIIAFNGSAPDLSLRGVWRSTTGNLNSYTRLAGGSTLGVDSVANWRGNAYDFTVVSGSNFYGGRRTLLALAPSNENILYVLYENGLLNISPGFDKEADLFKLDMTSGNNWTNLSANIPDFPGGNHEATDPFAVQGGYNLFVTVKPNDPNFVLIGGTSLYRSTNGFTSTANTSWIGGYGNTLPSLSFYGQSGNPADPGNWSHPDIHNLVFNPSNFNEAICANDGGLQITTNISSASAGIEPVTWNVIRNYQTLQYFHVTIDPETGSNNFAGGSQDNGTHFRDKTGLVGLAVADSNNHRRLIGGDGASVGISRRNGSTQFLYGGVQLGIIRRGVLQPSFSTTDIRPSGLTPSFSGSTSEFGEFVTKFKLNPDNTEDLYYVNFNRLFRTTSASTVTSSTWTELTGVSSTINSSNGTNIGIRAMAFTRGVYSTFHALYLGTTNGRVFRLDDPRNMAVGVSPVDISPPGISSLNVQDIAVNPNNDNEILVVISNYGITSGNNLNNVTNIWWTNNAKSSSPTWIQAEGNLAGTTSSGYISARSCMIVVKKDATNNPVTEYYVGTAAGLFGIENLGTTLLAGGTPTWQRESPSVLNFAVITSLAYRPSDNVMLVGTHGNGMYYTFLGTPNLVTGINEPVTNDKNFIANVFPTISSNFIHYRIGNKTDVSKISVQLFNMQGQEVFRKETGYTDGSIDLSRLAKGAYVMSIYSNNRKYRHVQKLIR